MDIITSDGIVFKLDNDFVSKSKILKDMPTEIDCLVPLSVQSRIFQHVIDGSWPSDGQTLLEIAKTTDYLDMEIELDEACRRVAESLRGKTSQEIRRFLNL